MITTAFAETITDEQAAQRERIAAKLDRLRTAAAAENRARGSQPAEVPLMVWNTRAEYRGEINRMTWKNSLRLSHHETYEAYRFDDLKSDQHPTALRLFVKKFMADELPKKHLVLFGGTGAGKTTALCALGGELADAGRMVRYVKHGTYLSWLRPDQAPRGWTATLVREFFRRCDVLILDELGSELGTPATAFAQAETFELVNDRLAAGLPTAFGTNLPSDDLALVLGDRVMSRIAGQAVPLEFEGPDRRKPVTWGRRQNPPRL